MTPAEETVCAASETAGLITEMARTIWEGRRSGVPFSLVGIRTRGVTLAQRLAQVMSCDAEGEVLVGAVDITLYRDDLGHGRSWPVLHGTDIPFPVDGAEIVLVDDVLFTGRTVRAALNAICDLGRPDRIRLAVLVERGHRELPIQPDIVGLVLPTSRRDRVRVRLHPQDPGDEIVRVLAGPRSSSPDRSLAP
jgi:pyrimidine operon attenuation protein/uracil phosphoribosyltransferase